MTRRRRGVGVDRAGLRQLPDGERVRLGGEIAPGKIVAGVGSWEDQRLFVVDLDSGQMKQFAEHLAPVLQHQNYFEPANFAPAPGSEATKLFYDADESLIRLDPLTGERRVLLGGARP